MGDPLIYTEGPHDLYRRSARSIPKARTIYTEGPNGSMKGTPKETSRVFLFDHGIGHCHGLLLCLESSSFPFLHGISDFSCETFSTERGGTRCHLCKEVSIFCTEMYYELHDKVLHIMYEKKEKDTAEYQQWVRLSQAYEGILQGGIGMNFPLGSPLKKWPSATYAIVYPRGDWKTKEHELYHARYFLCSKWRKYVQEIWSVLSEAGQKRVTDMLKRMGYPQHVWMDEFQAYWFTEPPTFFGISVKDREDLMCMTDSKNKID